MKNIFRLLALSFIVGLSIVACDKDYTTPKAIDIDKYLAKGDNELGETYQKYLENLRTWKKTDHAISFGWFGGWTAEGSQYSYLTALPDSMDIVSIWGGGFNLTPAKQVDLMKVQEKGTKVIIGWIIDNIGDQIAWDRTDWPEDDAEAVIAYAGAIVDTINKYGYDGFDYDYEPTFASPFKPGNHCGTLTACPGEDKTNERLFITTMRELLGPDKILNLNGSIWHVDQDMIPEFNYFVYQNYGTTSDSGMESRFSTIKNAHGEYFDSKKLVFTESYERNSASTGGATSSEYEEGSVVGMSRWNPTGSRKGGVGIYHLEMGYTNTPPYKHLRKAISVMNPPVRE